VALLFMQVLLPYSLLVDVFKWLTLALFAYVGVVMVVRVPWPMVLQATFEPRVHFNSDYLLTIVAVLGTTISPYLFFWQASQEVEDMREHKKLPLNDDPQPARKEFRRTRIDTLFGMGFSNLIAWFVMLTAATVLHTAGITDIQTSAQAAEALRPIAGEYAFLLFALGIIGTGLLAVPVLAGSAAYAVSEALGWREGLRLRWMEARGFYAIVAIATLGGTLLDFTPIDPIKALFWSAVVNGVIAVPIMALLMGLVCDPKVMGQFVASARIRRLGWLATAVMAALAMVTAIYLFK
jgi:Mn2+/Fe2+ NRAMP family transporter